MKRYKIVAIIGIVVVLILSVVTINSLGIPSRYFQSNNDNTASKAIQDDRAFAERFCQNAYTLFKSGHDVRLEFGGAIYHIVEIKKGTTNEVDVPASIAALNILLANHNFTTPKLHLPIQC